MLKFQVYLNLEKSASAVEAEEYVPISFYNKDINLSLKFAHDNLRVDLRKIKLRSFWRLYSSVAGRGHHKTAIFDSILN